MSGVSRSVHFATNPYGSRPKFLDFMARSRIEPATIFDQNPFDPERRVSEIRYLPVAKVYFPPSA